MVFDEPSTAVAEHTISAAVGSDLSHAPPAAVEVVESDDQPQHPEEEAAPKTKKELEREEVRCDLHS